jgi:1-acyl-sn-glycerol-3-phosphate acyltransferase
MSILRRILGGGDTAIARSKRPQAMAAGLERPPQEGLDWLRRRPSARPPWLYRLLLALAGLLLFRLCHLRLRIQGREHLPEGGYVAVCALHRCWIDPLLLIRALPLEPRVWFMGSGPTAFDRRWKERLLRRTGGMLPVWRGGADVSVHVRAAAAVIEEGAVLGLFAEGAVGGPVDEPARMRHGATLLCLRTGAPIVPVPVCGAEELHRGKRMSVRILPPTCAQELLGDAWQGTPEPGSRAELRVARAMTRAISERIAAAIAEDHPWTLDPPEAKRRWAWLARLMR